MITLCALLILISSCASNKTAEQPIRSSYYKKDASQTRIGEWSRENMDLIARVQGTVFYRTYQFNPDQQLTRRDFADSDFAEHSLGILTQNESRAGTAVVLDESNGNAALLTADHIVNYPDTVWHYHNNLSSLNNQVVEAVSVKARSSYSIFIGDNFGPADIIINDRGLDLAVLSTRFEMDDTLFKGSISPGDSDRLEWADFVYAVGYPKGIKMITSGIVSKTERMRGDSFSLDASFNRGFSGGIVLAINSETSIPEWVGMLSSSTSSIEYVLVPEQMNLNNYTPEIPYKDTIYVERKNRINYGITHAVSINQIRTFLQQNRDILREFGYGLQQF
jgi:S1-C subfamily serine protease